MTEKAKDINQLQENGNGESWAEKVAKSLKEKVPAAMINKDIYGEAVNITQEIIYEDITLKDHLRVHKAEQIAQRTLEVGSVLFEFPKNIGLTNRELYKTIVTQIGNIEGATPYSRHGNLKGSNLIGIIFSNPEHAEQAIEKGIVLDEVLYKASPSGMNKSATPPKMVRVLLDYIPKRSDELLDGIFLSMSLYGKVCQIKTHINGEFFEGQVSVLLDTNDTDEKVNYLPLQRMC